MKSTMLGYTSRLFLILPFFVYSNFQDSIQKIDLDDVIVQSTRIEVRKKQAPLSVSVKNLLRNKNYSSKSSFSDYTNSIPGIYTSSSNNFSQDLRISIRGFGARSAFGIRGVKIIVDGIPETTPDGQSQLDNLPLSLISNIEVIRGPSSILYGNSSGGVININTLSNNSLPYFKTSAVFGAYQYQSIQRTRVFDWNNSSLVVHYDKRRSNGYRDFSGYKSNILNLKYLRDLNEKNKIVWQLNYTDSPYAKDAGGLKLSEVEDDRRQSRKNNFDYDTYEKVKHLKTGFSWKHFNDDNSSIESYFFYQKRDFNSKLPFNFGGIILLERDYYGLGTKYSKQFFSDNKFRTITLGIDHSNQQDDRKRFKNNLGEKGESTFDQIEKFKSTGVYFINQTEYNSGLLFRYGVRYDENKIGTDSEAFISLNKFNPSFGVSYSINDSHNIYLSAGTSFETPTLNELSNNPNGDGLNKSLDPSSSVNYEIGWRNTASNLTFDAIVYLINTDNEILPYELEQFPGKNFYRNVGSTRRYGIELSSTLLFSKGKLNLSYTNAKNTFNDFVLDGKNLNGLSLPGIPNKILDIELIFNLSNKSDLLINNRLIGELYADNLNETEVSSYNLFNITYSKKIFNNSEIYLGVNNLFDVNYFDNIRINAFGKRYYEPAPKRNFHFGLNFSF
jgi:iron complex outermembrane receptor protein